MSDFRQCPRVPVACCSTVNDDFLRMGKGRREPAKASQRPVIPLQRHRILVVEDDVEQREAVAALLESAGYVVERAIDGFDALVLAKVRRPDLALIDLAMPGLDGFELATRLRADARTRDIPLVAMTGRHISPTVVRMRGPFEDVLFKPLETKHLLPWLRERLRRQADGPPDGD